MRKLGLTTVALVALTTSEGFGADLPRPVTKAPPAPSPVASWTGCYVAGGGGYGFWNQKTFFTFHGDLFGTEATSGGKGSFGTIGGGCDLQISGSWVVGVFGDYDFASIRGDVAFSSNGTMLLGHEKLTSAWALGGRIGYLITPSILTYVSGGYTEARFSGADLFIATVPPFPFDSVPAHTYSGWFLGGGYEYDLGWIPGVFWRTEYRLAEYDRGSRAFLNTGVPVPGFSVDSKPFVQTIRSELVWRLNWGRSGADLPRAVTKAPPAALPVTNWTSCYVAGGGGYGFWNQKTFLTFFGDLAGSEATSGGKGSFGTIGGGCDLQISGSWVIGVLGDYDFASIRGDVAFSESGAMLLGHEKLASASALGGRIGYLITPSILTYVSGGYTEARFSGADLFFATVPPLTSFHSVPAHTYSGWFLGGGYEYNLGWIPGVFWRTEYRLVQYNRSGRAFLDNERKPTEGFSVDSKPFVQTIRSELVWRFNWGR